MQLEVVKNREEQNTGQIQETLLILGPLPPPIGGATVTVQTIVDELIKDNNVRVIMINTSPNPESFSAEKAGLNLASVKRIASIIKQYVQNINQSKAVLVFASSRSAFFIAYISLLLVIAHLNQKAFFLKPFGGALDLYLMAQTKPIRSFLLSILRSMDGILAQTRQLQTALIHLGCEHTHYVPGCRPAHQALLAQSSKSEGLRLIFLSLIYRQKGAMILLDALELLAREKNLNVSCDFYGPIMEDRDEFLHRVEATTGSHYCGVALPGTTSGLIAQYDVLILPTYAATEGHPGSIIEAIQVGIPVISTSIRAIPELITHGKNGFLVPPQDSYALAEMIKRLALDSSLRESMGRENYLRGQEFLPEVVVSQIIDIIFPRNKANLSRITLSNKLAISPQIRSRKMKVR